MIVLCLLSCCLVGLVCREPTRRLPSRTGGSFGVLIKDRRALQIKPKLALPPCLRQAGARRRVGRSPTLGRGHRAKFPCRAVIWRSYVTRLMQRRKTDRRQGPPSSQRRDRVGPR